VVVRFAPFLAPLHQPGVSQHRQVFRHGRLGNAGVIGQAANRQLTFKRELLKNRPPGRIAQGGKQSASRLHIHTLISPNP